MNDDNPPAFPRGDAGQYGMSLRDYFAGQALMGLVAGCSITGAPDIEKPYEAEAARDAYAFADAMLAVRAEGGKDA